MAGMRSYEDPCGIARALDLIGERWALLVVRELAHGPRRFTDLRTGLPGASPNVLSQRLRELEANGVVRRRKAGPAMYELTEWGQELRPLLVQLGRWGARSQLRPRGRLSVDALMLALEATFKPDATGELRAIWELRLGEERFTAELDRGALHLSRGTPRNPDAIIEADPAVLRTVVFGDRRLEESPVQLSGDRRVAKAFFRLFARPTPAAAKG